MRQAQGNPVAAGIIAFGAGLLAATLIPRTRTEEQAVHRLGEATSGLAQPVKDSASESIRALKEEAKDIASAAVDEVKDTATQAAQTTKQHAKEEARDVTDHARDTRSGS